MIGEFNIDGVFIPYLLALAVVAFVLSVAARRILRAVHFYRFVWHAGLFDVALFVVLLWLVAMISTVMPYGTR